MGIGSGEWGMGGGEWGVGNGERCLCGNSHSPFPTPHSPFFIRSFLSTASFLEAPRSDGGENRRARNQPLSSGVQTAESRFASLIREVSNFASPRDARD